MFRKGEHGRSLYVVADISVRVQGNEQIGLCFARAFRPLAQIDELVTVAHHDRPHAWLGPDQPFKLARDRQHLVFLISSVWTYGPGVLAAVTGIDDNHPHLVRRWLQQTDRPRWARRACGLDGRRLCDRFWWRRGAFRFC